MPRPPPATPASAPRFAPPRFEPRLSLRPVTQAELLDSALPAVLSLPQVALTSSPGSHLWTARRDLLASGPFADEFVAEIEADGTAQIRFGDDINGHRPEPGTAFAATYRVGSGPAGAIGADTLRHIALPLPQIVRVRNPLPSTGGVDPETAASVRARAPHAFRTQERTVTREDYAEVVDRAGPVPAPDRRQRTRPFCQYHAA